MFVPWEKMAAGHLGIKMCRRGEEKKRLCIASNATQVAVGKEFQARDQVLNKVHTLKQIFRMLSFYESDWPTISQNLQKKGIKLG